MNDYLDQKSTLQSLYNRFPTLENFEAQIIEKKENFNEASRATLVSVLQQQYATVATSALTNQNIDALNNPNTFTVTTGHQLNLFSGPLYFLYKIISTINLTKELKAKYPTYNFVPIYWMATEDHDFEEINYFNFKGKKFRWNTESTGPVGRLSTKGLEDFFEVYSLELGASTNAQAIKKMFKNAYLNHDNLADATRHLANELFGTYGLVIIDADNTDLKRAFIPFAKEELLLQYSHKLVLETAEQLKEYTVQVNPREINLFYMNENNSRERIVEENGTYFVNNTSITFTQEEIIADLHQNPDKFSPNVILRPLYQETILPNVAYIGGGGEIAYWLQLKEMFIQFEIDFPMLVLRNSMLIRTEKQHAKQLKLNLSNEDLFSNSLIITKKRVMNSSEIAPKIPALEDELNNIFERLESLSNLTDSSFADMIQAQRTKQLKGFERIKKRLIHAEVKQNEAILRRIDELLTDLNQQNGLQERVKNFADFDYIDVHYFIDFIADSLQPFEFEFIINTLNEEL